MFGHNQPGKAMTGSQGMSFLNNPNQTFRITSVADPNFCLDYHPHSRGLTISEHGQSKSQVWRVMNDQQGNYGFMNCESAGVLQIPFEAKGKQGAQCVVVPPSGNISEKWHIAPVTKGFTITSALNGSIGLDINEERMENNNKVIVWEIGSKKLNQHWCFIPA